jgi:hypothetical protein
MQDMHVLEREKLQNEMLEKIDKTTRKIAPTPNSQTEAAKPYLSGSAASPPLVYLGSVYSKFQSVQTNYFDSVKASFWPA